ncbi:RHS repeat-associated core domain-containing protein [Chitinophaga sp. CF118]|nr:RHS repeat-associated core domain-containing protein [Chitinophaga sp. CF118]
MRIGMIVWLLCCVMQVKAFTAIESYQHQLKGSIKKGDTLVVKDEKFLNNAFDWTKIHNKAVTNIITFGLFRDSGVVLTKAFKCQADLKIEYWSQPDQVDPIIVDHVKLDIGYDPQKGVSYQASATYRFLNGHRVKITINDITSAELGSELPAAFQLTSQIAVERWYDLDTEKTIVPKVVIVPANTVAGNSMLKTATAANEISYEVALSWDKITGAEEYDLEWTFIDEESDNGRLLTTAGSGVTTAVLAKMFRNNATRVSLQQEYYNISLVHFSKYLLVRARTVMYNTNGQRLQGSWSYNMEEEDGTTVPAVITLNTTWHLPAFNWQYSAVYAEEGKKKEIVSYFDGTLRTRQTVTVNNSDQKAVVQESIYDEFGRPLASILPAPVPESNLKYYPNLHLNSSGNNYSFSNVYGSGSNCINMPEPLGTAGITNDAFGGAGQYYSPLSKFLNTSSENKYIPDAGGYPFAVTRYTPDNTGRISVQGGVGAIFQPGNKATRYYYGKPEQWELDRLFGNDVGYASHYLKNMVVDGNGQISVSYQDASGKTIATALAGDAPANTDALASKTVVKSETFPVLQPGQFSFDPSKLKLSASATYMAAVPGNVNLAYNVEQLVKTYTAKGGVIICSNCYYELYIRITDNCNRTIYNTAVPIPVGSLTSDCSKTAAATGNIDVNFDQVGEYYISFELGLTQAALNAYTDDYVSRNTSLSTQYSFITSALYHANTLSCFNDCSTCREALGTKVNYVYQVKKRLAEDGVDTVINRSELTAWVQDQYDIQYSICLGLRTSCKPSPCQELENAIKKDVSPGGQYALFDANNLPLEKNINVLFLNWRKVFPVKIATDTAYINQQFELGNGLIMSPYDEKFTLDSLVKYWNPDWAIKFESYHPEYCALRFCNDHSKYLQWDDRVKTLAESITDISSVIPGAVYSKSNPTWLIDKDSFFVKYPAQRTAFVADLANYSSNIAGITNTNFPVKDLVGYVDYMLYCSDYTGNTNSQNIPVKNANNWTNCSPVESCRMPDMEWRLYRDKYLELKQKYFQIARNTSAYCGNTGICAVGNPSSFVVRDCPASTDFIIQADPQSCPTCEQPVRIVYVGAIAITKPVTVKIYYPAEYSGVPKTKSVSFTAGQKEVSIPVDHTIPVNSMRVADVLCDLPFCEQYAKSSSFRIVPIHLADQTWSYTMYYTPSVPIPVGGSMSVRVIFYNAATGSEEYFQTFNFDHNTTSDERSLPGTNGINYSYSIEDAIISCYVPSVTPPASSCDTAFQYKISRINSISYNTPVVSTDTVALKAIADAQFAAQLSANCEAQADNWMQQLAECLSSATQDKKDLIKAKLIAVCKLGADVNHPNGASTTAGGVLTADGYNSFSQVIKGEMTHGAFTMTCNPWLLDAPYPYDTKAQATTNIIHRTNNEICARLTALTQEYNTPGGNLYQYLVDKYGTAMNLTADEFTILQKGCVNCRYLLEKDLQLPVFLDGTAKGCVSPAEFNQGITALQQEGWLLDTDANYENIYATYLNHRWGFTLSYAEYKGYADLLIANPGTTTMLCNQPVYVAVKRDPYSCLMEVLDDAVSRGKVLYKEYIAEIRRQFRKDYIAYCGSAKANVQLTAAQQLYHYTLYYYDQAGNLVRTVPPEGVHLVDASLFAAIDAARVHNDVGYSPVYPAHSLTTSYAYQSLNGIRLQHTPDGGNTQFYYDRLGRLFASHNDVQGNGSLRNFSYTKYDAQGRIKEVGENAFASLEGVDQPFYEPYAISLFFYNTTKRQVTRTHYDEPYENMGFPQENLRKRVSAITYHETDYYGPQQGTYYSYDQLGNVKTLWQQMEGLETKQIDYQYDLVSGKVNKVGYQRDATDKFYYSYQYDAENRLTKAFSGTDVLADNNWEISNAKTDASYRYYLHGPLARMELGNTELVQGLDYAYTLQGWLKGVNGQYLSPANEMGQDGLTGNVRSVIGRDVYAYSLDYFKGDYKPIGGNDAKAFPMSWTPGEATEIGTDLFNGNISRSTLALSAFNTGTPVGYTYRYDQLNRLTAMRQHIVANAATSWDASSAGEAFMENVSYDANGNILNYFRNGSGAGNKPKAMDNLNYGYSRDASGNLLNNKLLHVKDAVTNPNYTEDLKTQGDNNYLYDNIGNLISDAQAGISNITWTVYGKIERIDKTDGSSLEYRYDAAGNRVYKAHTHGPDYVTDKTWYVRDAQGNTLAIYGNKDGGSDLYWKEQHLYGSSRLGIWEPDLLSGDDSQTAWGSVGKKRYELTNHLGNVLATISDKSLSVSDHYEADLLSAQDYYPFGMLQPDRSYTLGNYRYGFNGKENDNETGTQDYGLRIYDGRVGRFLSVDPITKSFPMLTPYQFASNSPVANVDLDGGEAKYNAIEIFKTYKNGKLILANTRITEEKSKAAGWFINGKPYQFAGKLGNGTLYSIVSSETTLNKDGSEETVIKNIGAIYVPEPPEPAPDRAQSHMPVNIIVWGSSQNPNEGYGDKPNPNAKTFIVDYGKFNEDMDIIMAAQPGELGKPDLEVPSALDFIGWTGGNGGDIIKMVQSYVLRMPDSDVGYCMKCKQNYDIDKGKLSFEQSKSTRPAGDTFPSHMEPAKSSTEIEKSN